MESTLSDLTISIKSIEELEAGTGDPGGIQTLVIQRQD